MSKVQGFNGSRVDASCREGIEVLVLRCEPDAPAIIRRRLDVLFNHLAVPPLEAYGIKVAVGEALGNAIRHGCKLDADKFVTVRIEEKPDMLVFEISDEGPGFHPDEVSCDDCGGMGLTLMRHLMDNVEFDFRGGTTVRLTKQLHRTTKP